MKTFQFFKVTSVFLILLFASCTSYEERVENSLVGNVQIESESQIIINTYGLSNNVEALLESNKLYYILNMNVDYDNYGDSFWQEKDTVIMTDYVFKRLRKGACQNSAISDSVNFCMEQQEHTIDKKINKVTRFKGIGSGYFTTVDFKYDKSIRLKEYKEFENIYELEYKVSGDLDHIYHYELLDGKKIFKSRIIFMNTGPNN